MAANKELTSLEEEKEKLKEKSRGCQGKTGRTGRKRGAGAGPVRGEMKQEVDNMLTEMKHLAEDIKGSMVDEEL